MILLINFGGPRDLDEVPSFLTELLTDRDVIRTRWPGPLHRWFFGRVARNRAKKIREDYSHIGGRSPIYFDTEALAKHLGALTFHRYLTATHAKSLAAIEACPNEITVLPLFPQFSFATTGSIARFFSKHLTPKTIGKLRWVKSYPDHPAFVLSYAKRIFDFLAEKKLKEEEIILLFSCHGVPQLFVETGDIYQEECNQSFVALRQLFPKALCKLSYQSKFGRGEWIKPYTDQTCENILTWSQGRKQIVIIPLSFTSDHIETLFEIESLYLPILQKQGLKAYRCPALNLEPYWIDNLLHIAKGPTTSTELLIRK